MSPRKVEGRRVLGSAELHSIFRMLTTDERLRECRIELHRQRPYSTKTAPRLAIWEMLVFLPNDDKIDAVSYLKDFAAVNELQIDLRGEIVVLKPPFELVE